MALDMDCVDCAVAGVVLMFNQYKNVRDQLDGLNADLLELKEKYDSYVQGIREIFDDLPITLDEGRGLATEINALRKTVKAYQDAEVPHLGGLPTQLILYRVGAGPIQSWSCGTDGFDRHARIIAEKPGVEEVVYYKAVSRTRNKIGGDEVGEYEELGE